MSGEPALRWSGYAAMHSWPLATYGAKAAPALNETGIAGVLRPPRRTLRRPP